MIQTFSIRFLAFVFLLAFIPFAPARADDEPERTPLLNVDLREALTRVPATVTLINGKSHTGEMQITHFRPKGEGPFPAVIMHHGRGESRKTLPRYRFIPVARFWVQRGYAVFVPTRLGYGDSGFEVDPEETGLCTKKQWDVMMSNTSAQSIAAIEFAIAQPWVDRTRVIVSGQSVGGVATIATMAKKHPSVIAGINFAGGAGGDPKQRAGDPCSPFQLGSAFEVAAKANGGATPMLWLYAENDKYWGERWPRKWHDAYTSAGGKAHFVQFPPVAADGHTLIANGAKLWQPEVEKFLRTLDAKR